jgi:hypothetical protein
MLRSRKFNTGDLYREAHRTVIEACAPPADGHRRTWILAIDGTSTRRGGFTKIANALQYKKKQVNVKGRSTKAFTFEMGLLMTEKGARPSTGPRGR